MSSSPAKKSKNQAAAGKKSSSVSSKPTPEEMSTKEFKEKLTSQPIVMREDEDGDRRESAPPAADASGSSSKKRKEQASKTEDGQAAKKAKKPDVELDEAVVAMYGGFIQKDSLAGKQGVLMKRSFDTVDVSKLFWKSNENKKEDTQKNTPGFGKIFYEGDDEYQAMFDLTAVLVTAAYLDGNGNTSHEKTKIKDLQYAVCVREDLPEDYVDMLMRRDERNMAKLGQELPANHRETLEKQVAEMQKHITAVFDGAERIDKHCLTEMVDDQYLGVNIHSTFDSIVDGKMLIEYKKRVDKTLDLNDENLELDENDPKVIALRKELLAEVFMKFKDTLHLVRTYQDKKKDGVEGKKHRCMWFSCPVYQIPYKDDNKSGKDDEKEKEETPAASAAPPVKLNKAEIEALAKGMDPIEIKETMERHGFERRIIHKVDNKARPIPAPANPFTDVQVWPMSICSFKVRIKSTISKSGMGIKGELFVSKTRPFQVNRAGRKVSNFQEEQVEMTGGGEWDDISE